MQHLVFQQDIQEGCWPRAEGKKKYPKHPFQELDETQLATKLLGTQLHAPTPFHFAKTWSLLLLQWH